MRITVTRCVVYSMKLFEIAITIAILRDDELLFIGHGRLTNIHTSLAYPTRRNSACHMGVGSWILDLAILPLK